MTQEDKELLLKDLSARLPYGVYVHFCHTNIDEKLTSIELGETINYLKENGKGNQGEVFPYLRPWSSMTGKEKEEERTLWDIVTKTRNDLHYLYTDFLVSHHFDYRGLIEKGLALEAPDGMYGKWTSIRGNLKEDAQGNIVGGLKL